MPEKISFKLPDGQSVDADAGIRVEDLAERILPRMKKKIVGAVVNNEIKDLRETLTQGGTLEFLTVGDERALEVMRHSTSHLMAEAVLQVFPDAVLGIGPSTDEGFYYDFQLPRPFEPEDVVKIEKIMQKLAKHNNTFDFFFFQAEDGIRYFEQKGETFKVELIRDLAAKGE
nr:TGS domain-containing protein [bacterium]